MSDNMLTCNLGSDRAVKARTSLLFDKELIRGLLWTVVAFSLAGWVGLVFVQHIVVGHLLLAVGGLLAMPLFWYHGELEHLPPSEPLSSVTDITSVLDRKLLARLSENLTPRSLSKIVAKQPGGLFYLSRFAVSHEFLEVYSSDDPITINLVWHTAVQLAAATGVEHVSSSAVVAGIILAIPNYNNHLAILHIDGDDIIAGVNWYAHIEKVIAHHKARRSYGGIGRDLSFGWAPLLNRVGINMTVRIPPDKQRTFRL